MSLLDKIMKEEDKREDTLEKKMCMIACHM